MIGYTNDTGFQAENQIGLWYKLRDKADFMNDLKITLGKRFGMDHR
ncbi:hypothetical protein [Methanospirillum lacunae]|nr:hypothetical protein [Methanospirillum lacunae]